ncbi:MAG: hypothetical protein HY873_07910 [Chloroflexi bacterium]|nr:hypothetical protein [Chloroflexota bacterium]
MGTDYWNLLADVNCPYGHPVAGYLQTSFLGEEGSCIGHHRLGEVVPDLRRVSVILEGDNDYFLGDCRECKRTYRFGAEIALGKVLRVWPLPLSDAQSSS